MKTPAWETISLTVLLVIVGLRPLIAESFHTEETLMVVSMDEVKDPWASVSLLINLTIVVVAATVTWRSVRRARGFSRGGCLGPGFLILCIASVISVWGADDVRPALNATIDLLGSFALCIALVQLLNDQRAKLAICVIVASGVASAVACAEQSFLSFGETERWYHELCQHSIYGADSLFSSPHMRQLFENRMYSREATAYFSHSNVAGAYLLIPAFCAIGAFRKAMGARSSSQLIVAVMVVMLLCWAVWSTKGMGTLVAGIAGCAILVFLNLLSSFCCNRKKLLFCSAWLLVVLSVACFIVCGIMGDGFANPSLDFRWDYWTSSLRMFQASWTTGVGAENFGDHYLSYKPITSPEEVKNPHNFIVQFATEYGALGLTGALVLLVTVSHRLIVRGVDYTEKVISEPRPQSTIFKWAIVVFVLIFGVRTQLLPSRNIDYIIWSTFIAAGPWIVGFVAIWSIVYYPRGHSYILTATAVGLIIFLLQDTINFALFVPGSRTTFFAALAIVISGAREEGVVRERQLAGRVLEWLQPFLIGLILLVTVVVSVTQVRAERSLRCARNVRQLVVEPFGEHPALAMYKKAIARDTLDATAAKECGRWLLSVARNTPNLTAAINIARAASSTVEVAITRSPTSYGSWRLQAVIQRFLGTLTEDKDGYVRAVEALEHALKLYPENPTCLIDYGDCLAELGGAEAMGKAAAAWKRALVLDDLRPEWEVYRRLSPEARNAVVERLKGVRYDVANPDP